MTEKRKRQQMSRVLTMKYQQDQSSLAAINSRISALAERFEKVGDVAWSQSDVGNNLELMGYSDRTENWIARTRRDISIEMSAEYAKRADAEAAMRKSFGRLEAFKTLAGKQEKAAQRLRERRQVS